MSTRETHPVARCLTLAALFSICAYLVRLPGTVDVTVFWLPWIDQLREQGWVRGYAATQSDYPPMAFLFLHFIGLVSAKLGLGISISLKTAIAACALLSAAILHIWRRNFPLSITFAFALLLSSAAHGYLDVVWLPPFLLSLWALESRRLVASGILFCLAVSIKWQPVLIAPFLVLHAARLSHNDLTPWRERTLALVRLAAGALIVALPVILVIPPAEILKAFDRAGQHPGLSYQALNINWIIQHIQYQSAGHSGSGLLPFLQGLPHPLLVWPRRIFYLLFGLLLLAQYWRGGTYRSFLCYALTGFLTYCTVNNGVHENHLFLVMVLAFLLAACRPSADWPLAGFAALTANVNLFVFYGLDGNSPLYLPPFTSGPVNIFLLGWSALNFVFFVYCWKRCLRESDLNRPDSIPSGSLPGSAIAATHHGR